MGCGNLSYQFNFQPISQLSVNFANRKSQVTVKMCTNLLFIKQNGNSLPILKSFKLFIKKNLKDFKLGKEFENIVFHYNFFVYSILLTGWAISSDFF